MTLTLLELMNRLARAPKHAERRDELRQALGKLRNLLSAGEYRLIREVVKETTAPEAHHLHLLVGGNNDGLTGEACQEVLAALREQHPEEFVEKKNLWEDGYIYTSAEGLARRQAELERLMHVEIPRNAEAIGKAASLGDLRENWEYKSALEERDRLVERTTRMREEVSRAKVLQPDMIPDDEVNVGTAVVLREVSGGALRRARFVGAWDADIGKGDYSYLAPISLRFMGRKVGDRVRASFEETESEYEITGIEKVT